MTLSCTNFRKYIIYVYVYVYDSPLNSLYSTLTSKTLRSIIVSPEMENEFPSK